jgi:pseudouridine synthase
VKQRIQKVLANAGVASRRKVEEMVLAGRIAVNGKALSELPILIDPQTDRVTVDSEPVKLGTPRSQKRHYFLLNKPKGVYCTNVAQGDQIRAIDLLPLNLRARLYPVGRLDAQCKGLLLLTDDGELTNRLTHPRYGVVKTYRAVVDGYVGDEVLQELHKGIWLGDSQSGSGSKAAASDVRIVHRSSVRSVLDVTLPEGRDGQVRRMLGTLGHKVRELTRVRMGPLELQKLAPGQFRQLTGREVRELWDWAAHRAPQAGRLNWRGEGVSASGRAGGRTS